MGIIEDVFQMEEKECQRQEDKEDEPAIEQRREYTVFGLVLSEREEQVVCHASALALAMTDEARREAVR